MKTAFIFPGQGSQYVGMGKDFYDQYETAKAVFQKASLVTGMDIEKICFEPNEEINITEYTQIAMLTAEIAMFKVLEEKGLKADVYAGLSLGEYGALVASGALSMEDAFKVVRERGKYMQEAYPEGGAMTAVIGMTGDTVAECCSKVTEGIVSVANYNCPGQIVITGESEAVNKAAEICKEAGARRCIPLKVSGPFHSALLTGAGEKLSKVLEDVTIHEMTTPYLTNVTGDYVKSIDEVKDFCTRQVSSSVLWQPSVEKMIADGVTTFVEIGPGKTLTGFLKKINPECKGYNVEKVEDVATVVEALLA